MNKLFPTALGLKVAIAISAGGVLVQHPLHGSRSACLR